MDQVGVVGKGGSSDDIYQGIPESSGAICNLRIFSDMVESTGFLNFTPDRDGMVRRLPLILRYKDEIFPSLALAAVLKNLGTDTITLKRYNGTLSAIHVKGIPEIPVDGNGRFMVRFRGERGSYDYVSASDILLKKIPSGIFRGRTVFVGTSAEGLKELRTTPFDPIIPGVEIHATVADNLLSGSFISTPSWSEPVTLLVVAFCCTLLSLAVIHTGVVSSFSLTLGLSILIWLSSQQLFIHNGIFVGALFPILSIFGHYILLTAFKYRLEERRNFSGMRKLVLTQEITIDSMANLAEYRDPETGGHIHRTRIYVKILAEHIRGIHKYSRFLNDTNMELLSQSAPLHDIGKVGIPDNILLKPDRLSEEEFEIMKRHTLIGRDVIENSVKKLGKHSFLTIAAEIAYSHHEKWNGTGYPQGLKGDQIPISGRLMALADVYDALISKRVYKPPFAHSKAVSIIEKDKGVHFDPEMVDAFLEIHEQFRAVAREFADFQEERDLIDAELEKEREELGEEIDKS